VRIFFPCELAYFLCSNRGLEQPSSGGLRGPKRSKKANFGRFCGMGHYPTHREKTRRAMEACLDLIDTAEWLKSELRPPLDSFDLTFGEFRVLELLNRKGPLTVRDAARERKSSRQNLKEMSRHLERRGWVRRLVVALPPVPFDESHKPKSKRDEKRKGRRVGVMILTPSGKRFVRDVMPNHSKMMKALMRVLDAREQLSLSRLCRKLRSGEAVFKFLQEIRMVDEDQEAAEVKERVTAELERLTARMGMRSREFRV
jgi:MarR family transcriptional regulator, 2-MHQ and catechol-resistance regulon repressor